MTQQPDWSRSSEWKIMHVGDILTEITGGSAKATKALADRAKEEFAAKQASDALAIAENSYPYIQSQDLQNTRAIMTEKRILKSDVREKNMPVATTGRVLLAAARVQTVGRCGILLEDAIVNNAIQTLKPDLSKITLDFLFYYFRLPTTQNTLRNILIQYGRPQLRQEDTRDLPILVPSLETQARIVRRLDALMAEIQRGRMTLNSIRERIVKVQEASIDKFFTALVQDRNIPKQLLRNHVVIAKRTLHSSEALEQFSDVPYISLTDLAAGSVQYGKVKVLSKTDKKPGKFYVLKNTPPTILYALTAPYLKRVALLDDTYERVVYNPNILALTINTEKLDASFCIWALMAAPFTQFISGTVIERVNPDKLLDFPLPLPPLTEQKRIVEELKHVQRALSEMDTRQIAQRETLEELENSVIDKAFRGEL